jgi:hypothetical protein
MNTLLQLGMELGWEQLQEAALPTGLSPVLIITENNATITIIQLGYLRTKYQLASSSKYFVVTPKNKCKLSEIGLKQVNGLLHNYSDFKC